MKKGEITLLEYLKNVRNDAQIHDQVMCAAYGTDDETNGHDWIGIKPFVDDLIIALEAGVFKDTPPMKTSGDQKAR